MRKVLNVKVYVAGQARERAMKSLDSQIINAKNDLDVQHALSLTNDEYVEIYTEGTDQKKLLDILQSRFGERKENPTPGDTYTGILEQWSEEGFTLDIGLETMVSSDHLEEVLGRGTPSQIRERYGLVQHIPLEMEYRDESVLTEEQIDTLWSWRKTGQGRLNVNSCTRSEIRATINRAGHSMDIQTVERLGLLEQSVICERDTDPPGLLADIGEYVNGEMLCVVT